MPRKKRGVDIPGMKLVEAPAQFWKRGIAFLIDLLVIDLVIISPFKKYLESFIPTGGYSTAIDFFTKNVEAAQTLTLITIMITIFVLLYFSILDSKIGQTLGKYLFGIYVKSEDNKPLSFWRCLLNNLHFIPFFPFIILWVVDPIHMFFSPKKQRLMQKFAKIVVVQKYMV